MKTTTTPIPRKNGGARAGSGRKAGGTNSKTKIIAEQAAAQGITPIEVMLQIMRKAWEEGDMDAAKSAARDAAPYCHPRLASVEANVSVSQHEQALSDLE